MEPYYNRRGTKDIGSVCGMTRGNQTMLLMLAMVASMAVVLLWESAPFSAFNNAQSQIPKSGMFSLPRASEHFLSLCNLGVLVLAKQSLRLD